MNSVLNFLFPPKPGQSPEHPIELLAVPGLTTFLDVALFRANEAQLTATICSSHALLACWLDIKHQSQVLLQSLKEESVDLTTETIDSATERLSCEAFCRQCLETSMDAMEKLSTEKLSQSANLSDPFDSMAGGTSGTHHHGLLSGVGIQGIASGILESKQEYGRRYPIQKLSDCWESARLFCPDFVWADEAFLACQRWLRILTKHSYILKDNKDGLDAPAASQTSANPTLTPTTERIASILVQLILSDLPMRLYQFRQAIDAESVVTKRLYLVKCEYRGTFRHFLEAHQSLLRAPPMELVEKYLKNPSSNGESLKSELQSLLKTPQVVEMFALEREAEQLELDMGQAIFPFSELARSLDHKKARLKVVPGILEEQDLPALQETVRRLKCVLCRKAGSETSSGIRPILLDLQGIPRDDELDKGKRRRNQEEGTILSTMKIFLSHLQCLAKLAKTKNAFQTLKEGGGNGHDAIDFSHSVLTGCTEFDSTLLKLRFMDWHMIVTRQKKLQNENMDLPDKIAKTEMKVSIAGATKKSLNLVKERLELMTSDRQQRLDVLQEMVQELCLREMNIFVKVKGPDLQKTLELKETSALGFLGVPLQLAGEPLPVG